MPDRGIFDHMGTVSSIFGGFVAVIIGLVVYVFGRMVDTVKKMGETIEKHADENDKIHDTIFKTSRTQGEILAAVKAVCDERKPKG